MPFVYPYNYIRPGMRSRRLSASSHAHFQGLSGTIHCKLTTETPLFTPDPASNVPMDVGTPGHRELRFFECDFGDGGGVQYALPGTGLKGMIRSVAETLSNSCWSQFDGGRVRASRPLPDWWNTPHRRRRPGRLLHLANGEWVIRHMTEAWLPLDKCTNADGSDKFEEGNEVWVQVNWEDRPVGKSNPPHIARVIKCTEISAVQPVHMPQDWRHGYVKIVDDATNQGPDGQDGRHYQRVFLDWQKGDEQAWIWPELPNPHQDDVPVADIEDLKDMWMAACWGPDDKDKNPVPLKANELVWYSAAKEEGEWRLDSLGPVALYKRRPALDRRQALENLARHQILEVRPDFESNAPALESRLRRFEPCRRTDQLCLCCRLFGFVGDGAPTQEMTAQDIGIALAGKVSFSFATAPVQGTTTLTALPLRILGEPKPKFAPFNVINPETPQSPPGWWWDKTDTELRGRKGYWHHHDHSPQATYYSQPDSDNCQEGKSGQNATVTSLASGAVFDFDVDFCDLSEAELGCLLMALTLELTQGDSNSLRHKFGMGKPVGLGSCRIEVEQIELRDHQTPRYRATNLFGAQDVTPAQAAPYLEAFREHLLAEARRPGNAQQLPFEELPQIRDASILWKYPPPTDLPIRYNPNPDHAPYLDAGFEYFVGHSATPLKTLDEVAGGDGQPD